MGGFLTCLYRYLSDPNSVVGSSDPCQPDAPHLINTVLESNATPVERTCVGNSDECKATQYYGKWEDNLVCEEPKITPSFSSALREEASLPPNIDFVMLCPKPMFVNTGPHRVMVQLDIRGDKYVMAAEEGDGSWETNLFVSSYSPSGMRYLKTSKRFTGEAFAPAAYEMSGSFAEEVLATAIYETTGLSLNQSLHTLSISIEDDPYALLNEGCKPSPKMSIW